MLSSLLPEFVLRSLIRHLGEKRPADQRTGDDLHPSQFLQLNGRHGPVLFANLRESIAGKLFPLFVYRQLRCQRVVLRQSVVTARDGTRLDDGGNVDILGNACDVAYEFRQR